VMLPPDNRSPADVRTTAIHEVGHAVVAHRLGFPVHHVSILREGETGGITRTGVATLVPTLERLRDQVTVALGGRAADIAFGNGPNTGAADDLARATSLLLDAYERQGLGATLVASPNFGIRHPDLIKSVDDELKRLLDRAIAILEDNRSAVMELVQRLIDERVLSGADVAEVLSSGAGDTHVSQAA
jgi:cell division protease FtsH